MPFFLRFLADRYALWRRCFFFNSFTRTSDFFSVFGLWPWSVAVLLEPLELIRSRRCSFDI